MTTWASRIAACAALTLALGLGSIALRAQPAPQPGPGAAADPSTFSTDPAKAQSGEYVTEPSHVRVVWVASHMGFSHFYAVFPKVTGTLSLDVKNPANSKVSVAVDINSVTTGVAEAHFEPLLKSDGIFAAAKYPTATFTSTKIVRTAPNKAEITGNMTIKGVTKPVTIDATFNQSGVGPNMQYRVGFDGHAVINRHDFGINAIGDVPGDITLLIEAEFIRADQAQP